MSDYRLLRVKREWVPETAWRMFCLHRNPSKRLALRWPWRVILTRDANSAEEALEWWSQETPSE